MMKTIILILLLIGSFILSANEFDWGWSEPDLQFNGIYDKVIENEESNNLHIRLIHHYRKSDSPWRGNHCPCFPSCSTFTLFSMNKFGFITGFFMGMDRIFFRENFNLINKINYYSIERTSFIDQKLKSGIYDPPKANNIFQSKDWRSLNPYFYFIHERNSSTTN